MLFTRHTIDYRPALQKLLHTLLFTYHSVLGSLLVPPYAKPPDQPEWKYEWERQIDWIKIVAINMISAVNELRPVQVGFDAGYRYFFPADCTTQARETLDLTLRSQLANRRQETKAIHA
jgi:mediator of RNA polymerase II transcription subunit 7